MTDKEAVLEENGVELRKYEDSVYDGIYRDPDKAGVHATVIDSVEYADTREEAVALAYSWLKNNIRGV